MAVDVGLLNAELVHQGEEVIDPGRVAHRFDVLTLAHAPHVRGNDSEVLAELRPEGLEAGGRSDVRAHVSAVELDDDVALADVVVVVLEAVNRGQWHSNPPLKLAAS